MLVSKSVETENGTIKFEGELEQRELDFVLKVGLNYLLMQGAFPALKEQLSNVHGEPTQTQ